MQLLIDGWVCLGCPTNFPTHMPYHQDTDPYNPFQQHPDMFPDVPLGKCPRCFKAGKSEEMVAIKDSPSKPRAIVSIDTDDQRAEKVSEGLATNQQLLDARDETLRQLENMDYTEVYSDEEVQEGIEKD